AGVYGMNFQHMPELHWAFGYPFALLLMVGCVLGLFVWFRKSGWF
ncbi:MAG: magnesium transporter CorA, partial [Nocardioides sp.]|nr:magnesium transporter CorA [Nocardioides sp.]